MAQAQPDRQSDEKMLEKSGFTMEAKESNTSNSYNTSSSSSSSSTMDNNKNKNSSISNCNAFRFNAQAPEFVPRSHAQNQMPISGYLYPWFPFLGGSGSDWFYVGEQETATYLIPNTPTPLPNSSKNVLNDDLRQKIIKEAEYLFCDMSLLANEHLTKHMNKDPDGYVPISVIASTKKIRSLLTNYQLVAQVLRSSSKLVVSEDGRRVKRKHLFTDREREELQSRTVAVENLPEDHSHQNLENIFSAVGSVKTVWICNPQESNCSRSKTELFISNKLHALVEYGSQEVAERAVEKLNDERDWRKGLRVRLLLRCSPKSVLKCGKSEFDGIFDNEDSPTALESFEDSSSLPHKTDMTSDSNAKEIAMGSKKKWNRGRGKGRGRSENYNGHGLLSSPSPQTSSTAMQCESSAKQSSKGPRMADGTRGFTMGRGKPLSTPQAMVNTAFSE